MKSLFCFENIKIKISSVDFPNKCFPVLLSYVGQTRPQECSRYLALVISYNQSTFGTFRLSIYHALSFKILYYSLLYIFYALTFNGEK